MPTYLDTVVTAGQTRSMDFTLQGGVQYIVDLDGVINGVFGALDDPFLRIYDPGGFVVAEDDDSGPLLNAQLLFIPTLTGAYTFEISGVGGATGGFLMRYEQDDFRNDFEAIAPLGKLQGGLGFGAIDYKDDADIFEATLIADLSYTLQARGADSGAGSLANPDLTLLGPDGSVGFGDADSGQGLDARLRVVSVVTSRVYLQVDGSGAQGTYIVDVGAGRGSSERDVVVGTRRADAVAGLDGDDVLRGGGGGDRLLGGDGDDLIVGDDGRDTLYGGDGEDILRGAAGGDALRGGRGADVLIGGSGGDLYVFALRDSGRSAPDVISAGNGAIAFQLPGGPADEGDRFDFSRVDADRDAGGDQAFRLGGAGAGRISLADRGADTLLRANVDADRAFEIYVVIEDGRTRAEDYNGGDFIL